MALSISRMYYGSKIVLNALVFERPGDILLWHVHEFNDEHITIVAKGEFLMEVGDEAPRTVRAGDLIDPPPGVWHQFTALIEDSKLFNIFKEELLKG